MTEELTYFHVSPSSGVPIYQQLMQQIRQQIASGRLVSGMLLPSVRQTASSLEVNPMTVSKAYSFLEREGILERVRGQGMRIAQRTLTVKLKERKQELIPLLEEVVSKAYQLALTPDQVHKLLDTLLKDIKK